MCVGVQDFHNQCAIGRISMWGNNQKHAVYSSLLKTVRSMGWCNNYWQRPIGDCIKHMHIKWVTCTALSKWVL